MNHDKLLVRPGELFMLKDVDADFTGRFKGKREASKKLAADIQRLAVLQDALHAQDSHAVLVIIQAMDAAGKDSVIEHVMSGVNPQGCEVHSFKVPSTLELSHDYLWRCTKVLPERGKIGIFNRSYYEEVVVVRLHPEFLQAQRLPPVTLELDLWQRRYDEINNFERYLVNNGTTVLKFFLNVSKTEQKERFLERIDRPEKNWKFSAKDVDERGRWREYMKAYEAMLNHTSTEWAPWYVIPADHKWFTRVAVADILVAKLGSLYLRPPMLSRERRAELKKSRARLMSEK